MRRRVARVGAVGVIEERQQAGQGLFEHVAAAVIHAPALADGVGHVDGAVARGGIELAHEERLVGGLGEEHFQCLQVPPGHGEDEVRAGDEFVGERLAALVGDVDAVLAQGIDGKGARRLSRRGVYARGRHAHVVAARDHVPEDAFGHGAAADVAGADKEDVFHDERPDGHGTSRLRTKRMQVKRRPPLDSSP